MMVLLKKDLRMMAVPGLALFFLLFFLEVYSFFVLGLGEWDLSSQKGLLEDEGMAAGILLMILVSMWAPRMMFQDLDGGQLSFLDQFPVSRIRLFLSRYTAFVLWLVGSLLVVTSLRVYIIEWHSVDSPIFETWRYCLYQWLAQVYFIVMITPIFGALSLLRQAYPWLAFALIFLLIIAGSMSHSIPIEARLDAIHYNFLPVATVIFIEDRTKWPVESALWLGSIGLCCFVICLLAYRCLGRPMRLGWLSRLLKTRWATFMLISLACVLGYAFINYLKKEVRHWRHENHDAWVADQEPYDPDKTLVEIREGDFIWLVQERDRDTFQEVIDQSQTVYLELLEELNVEPFDLGQPIMVVPSDRIPSYAGGVANWRRIRLARFLYGEELLQVFKHELTHVLIEIWSEGALRLHFDSTQTFHEGCAQWSEGISEDEKERIFLKAILQHHWSPITLDDLFSGDRLAKDRGLAMIYAFGNLFVEAILQSSNENQLANISLSFGELKDSSLSGVDLWQKVFQKTGLSIEKVRMNFGKLLNKVGEKEKELLNALPKPEAKLIKGDEGGYKLTPSIESNYAESKMIVDVDPLVPSPYMIEADANGEFSIPEDFVEEGILKCRLGWVIPDWESHDPDAPSEIKIWGSLSEIKLSE